MLMNRSPLILLGVSRLSCSCLFSLNLDRNNPLRNPLSLEKLNPPLILPHITSKYSRGLFNQQLVCTLRMLLPDPVGIGQ